MKIKSFSAEAVHGYLDFDINFNEDLTFLTGINGSGKTTVVQGLSALLSPSLLLLAKINYKSMAVTLVHQKRKVVISAKKDQSHFTLTCSKHKDPLKVPIFSTDTDLNDYRFREKEQDFYRETEANVANSAVFSMLRELPTPMLLGIERRGQYLMPPDEYYYYSAVRRRHRNVFSSSLTESLLQAAALAERNYHILQAGQRRLTEEFRRSIIMSALKYEEVNPQKLVLSFPPLPDRDFTKSKSLVSDALQELGIDMNEVSPQLELFFNRLKQYSQILKDKENLTAIMDSKDSDRISAAFEWMINRPQFERIIKIFKAATDYVSKCQRLNADIDNYLQTVNEYLKDGNKTIDFSRSGELGVNIPGNNRRPITSLSSGESQIVTILTHLAFNPAAKADNAFIVDEPELSLHLHWQELFIDSITQINPRIQVIVATHSPSIILERLDACIDLSRRQG